MSGMDRLTDEYLEDRAQFDTLVGAMARELLAHRRASQAAPAPSEKRFMRFSDGQMKAMIESDPDIDIDIPARMAPAPSDGLREALEECDCCVDGLQADGETPCPYCTKPKVPIADAAEALLEAHKSGAWPVGQGRTLQQVATIIDALHAALSASPAQEGGYRHD